MLQYISHISLWVHDINERIVSNSGWQNLLLWLWVELAWAIILLERIFWVLNSSSLETFLSKNPRSGMNYWTRRKVYLDSNCNFRWPLSLYESPVGCTHCCDVYVWCSLIRRVSHGWCIELHIFVPQWHFYDMRITKYRLFALQTY